jgi:hypothetical protein
MKFTQPISVIIAVGEGAPTDVVTGHRLANALAARGQDVQLVLQPGLTHTWRAARAALPYLLVFADQQFNAGKSQPVGAGSLSAAPSLSATPPQFQQVPHPPAHGSGTKPGGSHGTPHKRAGGIRPT